MQEHPLQALLGERLVPCEIAVLFVAREREPEMRQVHANLVRASRVQLGFEQTHGRVDAGPDPSAIEHCFRGLAADLLDPHAALAGAGQVFGQRQRHFPLGIAPLALDQYLVALVDAALAERGMKADQRGALFGDQQNSRGVAVQAMNKLQKLRRRSRRAHLFDQTEGDAAAAVHRKPGRLVDGNQCVILIQDGNRRR